MVVNLVLARHGESIWHAENRYAGSTDIELSDLGRRQAETLGRWAASADLAAVWCSPLRRARETAQPSAVALELRATTDARLVELDFGVAEGLTREEMTAKLPDDLAAFHADPVESHFPGGEDPRAAIARYLDVFAELEQRHPGSRVLVVAHSTAIRLALCELLDIEPARYRTVMPALGNCDLTEIAFSAASTALLTYNCPIKEHR